MSINGMRVIKSAAFEERFADRGPSGFRRKPKESAGYNPDQPRDELGRWGSGGGGTGGSAPDRGDGSGAQGTSPSSSGMPKAEFTEFVRGYKFKERLVVETTDGRKFVGRSVSKAADGENILVRGKYEGTKGRKTELESFNAKNTAAIKVDNNTGRKPAKEKDEPAPKVTKVSEPKVGIPDPPPDKFREPIIKEQDGWLKEYAAESGKSVGDLKKEWQSSVEEAVGKAKVYVAMPPEVLDRVLIEGRYKSQFETNASYGGDVQIEARREAEFAIFGTPTDIADSDRAVYGYASEAPPSNRSRGDYTTLNNHEACVGYGSVIVQYKDDVKERATITFGDSLNRSGETIPSPMLEPSFRSVDFSRYDATDTPAVIRERSVDAQGKRNDADERVGDYAEVQVHGGLSVSEIDTVWLRSEPKGRTATLLKERGVKWKRMP